MSRRDPPSRSLPGPDVPSPEVLDELLQAFAADVGERHRLEDIDLASPEVDELIGEPPPTQPTPPPQPQPEADVEVEVEVEGKAEGEVETATVVRTDPEPRPEPEPGAEVESARATTIVISAEHERPDAEYLEPLAAPGTEGTGTAPPGTVFIDDRDDAAAGDVVAMEVATSATRIEPRLRERRIAVRRAVGRKRLKWVFIATLVLGVIVAGLAVLGSSLFAIEDVEVEGAVYTDQAALAAVVDDLVGTPVLRADTEAAEQTLEAIPWVEDARVTTDFPHGATIELRERAPAATFAGADGRFRVIDRDGRVLDVLDSQPVEYLLLTSQDTPDLEPGQFAPPGFSAAAGLVDALTPEVRARAQSVATTGDGSDLRLSLVGPPGPGFEVRFGAARDLVTKLVRLQTWLHKLDEDAIAYLDVSTNEVITG